MEKMYEAESYGLRRIGLDSSEYSFDDMFDRPASDREFDSDAAQKVLHELQDADNGKALSFLNYDEMVAGMQGKDMHGFYADNFDNIMSKLDDNEKMMLARNVLGKGDSTENIWGIDSMETVDPDKVLNADNFADYMVEKNAEARGLDAETYESKIVDVQKRVIGDDYGTCPDERALTQEERLDKELDEQYGDKSDMSSSQKDETTTVSQTGDADTEKSDTSSVAGGATSQAWTVKTISAYTDELAKKGFISSNTAALIKAISPVLDQLGLSNAFGTLMSKAYNTWDGSKDTMWTDQDVFAAQEQAYKEKTSGSRDAGEDYQATQVKDAGDVVAETERRVQDMIGEERATAIDTATANEQRTAQELMQAKANTQDEPRDENDRHEDAIRAERAAEELGRGNINIEDASADLTGKAVSLQANDLMYTDTNESVLGEGEDVKASESLAEETAQKDDVSVQQTAYEDDTYDMANTAKTADDLSFSV